MTAQTARLLVDGNGQIIPNQYYDVATNSFKASEGGTGISIGGSDVGKTNPLFTYDITNIKGSQQLAALKGRSFKVWCTAPAVAAKYSAVQIWNPANSGYIVYVAAISGFNSTGTQQWYPLMDANKLTTDSGTINPQDSLNATSPPFKLCVDALTARSTNPSWGVPVSSTAAQGGGYRWGLKFL